MWKSGAIFLLLPFLLTACQSVSEPNDAGIPDKVKGSPSLSTVNKASITKPVTVGTYFDFMDSLVRIYQEQLPEPYGEHLIARANPWLIDTLAHTDYYYLKSKGVFNYDQKALVVLKPGDQLLIPDSTQIDSLVKLFATTILDINIPEYKLHIRQGETLVQSFPIRVGRNEHKYLAMAGRRVDLRTRTGVGRIVRISRNPTYINPSNNHVYTQTRRDDNKVTLLPQIPWLEPEVDGHRYGQLIHPTTNPITLGKAYSNGCIGTGEGDAWRIYYYAPLGTRIVIRYDLEVVDEQGDTTKLRNIYPGFEQKEAVEWPLPTIAATLSNVLDPEAEKCSCLADAGIWE